jgi:hypothetical protein
MRGRASSPPARSGPTTPSARSRSSGCTESSHERGSRYRLSRLSPQTRSYAGLTYSVRPVSASSIQNTSDMFSASWRKRSSVSRSASAARRVSETSRVTATTDSTAPSAPGTGTAREWYHRSPRGVGNENSSSAGRPVRKTSRSMSSHARTCASGSPRSRLVRPMKSAGSSPVAARTARFTATCRSSRSKRAMMSGLCSSSRSSSPAVGAGPAPHAASEEGAGPPGGPPPGGASPFSLRRVWFGMRNGGGEGRAASSARRPPPRRTGAGTSGRGGGGPGVLGTPGRNVLSPGQRDTARGPRADARGYGPGGDIGEPGRGRRANAWGGSGDWALAGKISAETS